MRKPGYKVEEYASRRATELRAELKKELEAIDKFVEEHGSFSEILRAHYCEGDGPI